MSKSFNYTPLKIACGLLITGTIAKASMFKVEQGHRALIFDIFKGIKEETLCEGIHFRIPYIQKVIMMEVRAQVSTLTFYVQTKSNERVTIDLRIISRPDPKNLDKLYKYYGPNYKDAIIPAVYNEIIKNEVAKFENPIHLFQRRMDLHKSLNQQAKERLEEKFYILIEDTAIIRIDFEEENQN